MLESLPSTLNKKTRHLTKSKIPEQSAIKAIETLVRRTLDQPSFGHGRQDYFPRTTGTTKPGINTLCFLHHSCLRSYGYNLHTHDYRQAVRLEDPRPLTRNIEGIVPRGSKLPLPSACRAASCSSLHLSMTVTDCHGSSLARQ
jgi:hypothetical protein